jgi:hypothetical protein
MVLKLHSLILLSHTNCLTTISIAVVLTVEHVYRGSLLCESQESISMHVWSQVIEELYTKMTHTLGDHVIFGVCIFQRKMVVSHVHLPFAPTVLLMIHAIAHKFRAMNNHYNSNYNDSDIRMWNEQQINNLCTVCKVSNVLCCSVWYIIIYRVTILSDILFVTSLASLRY